MKETNSERRGMECRQGAQELSAGIWGRDVGRPEAAYSWDANEAKTTPPPRPISGFIHLTLKGNPCGKNIEWNLTVASGPQSYLFQKEPRCLRDSPTSPVIATCPHPQAGPHRNSYFQVRTLFTVRKLVQKKVHTPNHNLSAAPETLPKRNFEEPLPPLVFWKQRAKKGFIPYTPIFRSVCRE